MNTNSPWQSPDSNAHNSESGLYSPPETAPSAPPQYATPTPTWTPPPKPGLIPLRPMTLGTILSASLMVLRRNPRPIFGLSVIVMSVVTVASLVLVGFVTFSGLDRSLSAAEVDAEVIEAGAVVGALLAALVTIVLSLIGGALIQGIVSLEIARGAVGEKLRLRELLKAAKGRLWALVGWSALVAVALSIGFIVLAFIAAIFFTVGGVAGPILGMLMLMTGSLIGLAVVVWLGIFLSLVPSALMIERLTLGRAIRRSWSLVTGSFWRTFGILALIGVIIQVVSTVVTFPLSFIGGLGVGLLNPTGNEETMTAALVGLYIATMIISVAIGAIAIIIQSAAPALIYIDMRMRKEGFDLELTRFVDARNAGDHTVPDPYLTHDSKGPRSSEPSPYSAS